MKQANPKLFWKFPFALYIMAILKLVRHALPLDLSERLGCCYLGFLADKCNKLKVLIMRTQGEIEAAICEGVGRFQREYMGRGPKDIHTYLIGDLLVVRLRGTLTLAEQQLVQTFQPEKGRTLLKQVRTQLMETARQTLEAMILEITEIKVVSLHHDISTITGEEVIIFTLAESPVFREAKRG